MKDPESYLGGPGDEIPRRSREERLHAVFDLLSQAPRTTDAVSAYNLVEDSLHKAEKDEWQPMEIHSLGLLDKIDHHGKTILCDILFSHLLFLGDNGSIEIRVKDNTGKFSAPGSVSADPAGATESSTIIFKKSGAKGLGVWD